MMGVIGFIGGAVIGSFVSFFIASIFASNRIGNYQRIVDIQQKKLSKLAPDDHTCICCGKPVAENKTLCDDCLRNL